MLTYLLTYKLGYALSELLSKFSAMVVVVCVDIIIVVADVFLSSLSTVLYFSSVYVYVFKYSISWLIVILVDS